MNPLERRYDIDWLRVITIALLLIYHVSIAFQPWGVFVGFIQNGDSLTGLWTPMSMLNVWRIPLLFFVSGMGVAFALRKRSWKQLLMERSRRILIPFIFGTLIIVPIHVYLWQRFYNQPVGYTLHPVHLWFLGFIFLYVLMLSPIFIWLKKHSGSRFAGRIRRIFQSPVSLVLMTGAFGLETALVRPEIFETYAMTLHGFLMGMLAFFFGFLIIFSGNPFWMMLRKWKWISLIIAVVLYGIRVAFFDLTPPQYLLNIESCGWIFAVFGFGNQYLNRPGRTLKYLSQAAYPVYILHMIFLYLACYWIFPLELKPWVKFTIINLITFSGSFALYELIKRVIHIGLFFGIANPQSPIPVPQSPTT